MIKPEDIKDAAGIIQYAKQIDDSARNTKAAIDDLTQKFQAIQERQIDRAQEVRPMGGDFNKFVSVNGKVNLKSQVTKSTFAGRSVQVEEVGLLESAPVDEWHAELLRTVSARTAFRKMTGGNETPKLDAKILALAAQAPREIRGQVEKAISDTATQGAEWIPDTYSAALYEEIGRAHV